jgi:RAB protein geranylgeranyltransferase component A
MLIQIKDLTDLTPLPNLLSREETSYSCESTRLLEQRLVEYKNQSSQTEEILFVVNKKHLFLEYHPLKDQPTKKATQEIMKYMRCQ